MNIVRLNRRFNPNHAIRKPNSNHMAPLTEGRALSKFLNRTAREKIYHYFARTLRFLVNWKVSSKQYLPKRFDLAMISRCQVNAKEKVVTVILLSRHAPTG